MRLNLGIVKRAMLRVGVSSAGEIFGRAINIILPFAVIGMHGTSLLTDNFFLAMAVAFFVQGSLANVCITALVPEFINHIEKRDLSNFFRLSIMAGLLAAVFSLVLASETLSPFATVVSMGSIATISFCGIAAAPAVAALNANHVYGIAGVAWGFRIIPVLMYMLYKPEAVNLYLLLMGLAIADIMRMMLMLWLARKWLSLEESYKPLHFPQAARYLIVASSIAGLTPLLVRWIASFGDAGTVSLFEVADRIYGAIASIATIGVGNVTLVYLARLNNTNQEQASWHLIVRTWCLIMGCISVSKYVGKTPDRNRVDYSTTYIFGACSRPAWFYFRQLVRSTSGGARVVSFSYIYFCYRSIV